MMYFLLSTALAAVLYVDPSSGPVPPLGTWTTLGGAVGAAAPGDVIRVEPGDYSGEPTLVMPRTVTIEGTGTPEQVLFPAAIVTNSVVYGLPTVSISRASLGCPLDPLTPALHRMAGTLELTEVHFDCGDLVDRTGVLAEGSQLLTVTDSHFTGSGTMIEADAAPLSIVQSSFDGQPGGSRALLYRDDGNPGAAPDWAIETSTFTSFDQSGQNGGAIRIDHPLGQLRIVDTAFIANLAASGGGLYATDVAALVLDRSTFDGNGGNAVVAIDANTTVIDCSFTANATGGLYLLGPTQAARVERTTFRDHGGAALVSEVGGGAVVYGSHFCGNITDVSWASGNLNIAGSSFALGTGPNALVGAPSTTGTLSLQNVTMAGFDGAAVRIDAASGYSVFADEVIFHDLGDSAVIGLGAPIGGAGGYNNLFAAPDWAGGAFTASDFDSNGTTVDPMFQSYVDRATTTCDTVNLWLDPSSPLRDSGTGVDLNGSTSDIGAYGGPNADLVDGDGDNAFEDLDCNDADASVFPGAVEVAHDGIDQDCDGVDSFDGDADGHDADFAGGDDCDDTDDTIHPGATEVAHDGVDQDCDGSDLTDEDADGWDGFASAGEDCDDTDPAVNPDASEIWYDGIDQDCDGRDDFDQDDDGYAHDGYGGTDCNDSDPLVNPGAGEVDGNGVDEDCDGSDGPIPNPSTGTGTGGTAGEAEDDKETSCSQAGGSASGWLGVVIGLALWGSRRSPGPTP